MAKRIPEYVKYTSEELDNYVNNSGSCVKKTIAILHINLRPYDLNDFNKSLIALISKKKIGSYDHNLKGIILDIQNIKLLGNSGAIRFDEPEIHVDIRSDCYIFKPTVGAIVRGTVCHVSFAQICVIIYRVFNVTIRLLNKPQKQIELHSEIDFRVKRYCLENVFPYIEGELVELNILEKANLKRPAKEIDESDESAELVSLIVEIKKEEVNEAEKQTLAKRKKKEERKGAAKVTP